jgi:transcriptional regulator with XRE-family HTH domain
MHLKQPKTEKGKLNVLYPDVVRSGSPWSSDLVRELTDKEFRDEYMMDQVRSYVAFQIRALREQRRWLQGDLAEAADKTQSVISRIEDPDYGKLSLQTCLEIAIAFDLPLLVQFVEWDDWLARMSNVSPSALRKRSFDANRLLEIHRRSNQSAAARHEDAWQPASTLQGNLGNVIGSSAAANTNNPMDRPQSASAGVGLLGRVTAEGVAA